MGKQEIVIDSQEVLRAAALLIDKNPSGFYISDVFQILYPGEDWYLRPELSQSPTEKYNLLREHIRSRKQYQKLLRKTILKNYNGNQVINKPYKKTEPPVRSGWLKRFFRWVW